MAHSRKVRKPGLDERAGRVSGHYGLALYHLHRLRQPSEAYFANAPLIALLHLLTTYYMAGGLLDALQGQSTPGSILLDIAVTVSWMAAFLIGAILLLHRQTRITAAV